MIVGLDFDNTIVSYDALFHRMALAEGAIPASTPITKRAVRDYLRKTKQEALWTQFQSKAYGPYLNDAIPFPGFHEFLAYCNQQKISVFVVSHKTRFPYVGEQHDLRQAAFTWMFQQGITCQMKYGLSEDRLFFESTITMKCERIRSLKCDVFLDDLPEFLLNTNFPSSVHRVVFDPHQQMCASTELQRVGSWGEFLECMSRE